MAEQTFQSLFCEEHGAWYPEGHNCELGIIGDVLAIAGLGMGIGMIIVFIGDLIGYDN